MINSAVQKFTDECMRQRELFIKKNHDYGDSYKQQGLVGIICRLQDKINRVTTITKNSITMVVDESLEDTLRDLSVYAKLAIITMNENEENKELKSSKSSNKTQTFSYSSSNPTILPRG